MKKIVYWVPVLVIAIAMITCSTKSPKQETCYTRPEPKIKSEAVVPEWSKNAVIYEVNIRQYTPEGTFVAFEKHLPRLKELGVDILWIMPIHPISEKNRKGSLGSYYSVKDYKAINPEFGTMDDFKTLVAKCHEMGFKVIIDWVANHTGWDNAWIKEHPDWYTHDSSGQIAPPVSDWSDVADLNYDKPQLRAAMLDAMKFWVINANIDGFRCDVAGWVPTDFWDNTRASLDSIKPIWMLAEDEGDKSLLKKAFNANYSWTFHHIMNRIAQGKDSIPTIKKFFAEIDTTYPGGSYPMMFTSSHDENSWNGSAPERLGDALKTMAALSFIVPGMPMIYSGQEAHLSKRLRFFDKDTIDWSNLEMQQFYKKLTMLKHQNPALWNGLDGTPIHFLKTSENNAFLAFSRANGSNMVIFLANLSPKKVENRVTCEKFSGTFTDFGTDKKVKLEPSEKIILEAWEFKIFSKE